MHRVNLSGEGAVDEALAESREGLPMRDAARRE